MDANPLEILTAMTGELLDGAASSGTKPGQRVRDGVYVDMVGRVRGLGNHGGKLSSC